MGIRCLLAIVAIGCAATSQAQVPMTSCGCVQTERDYLVAYANLLKQEIAVLERRFAEYEPFTRFDSSAVGVSRDYARLLLVDRRMQLEMVRNQLRALGRSYSW